MIFTKSAVFKSVFFSWFWYTPPLPIVGCRLIYVTCTPASCGVLLLAAGREVKDLSGVLEGFQNVARMTPGRKTALTSGKAITTACGVNSSSTLPAVCALERLGASAPPRISVRNATTTAVRTAVNGRNELCTSKHDTHER